MIFFTPVLLHTHPLSIRRVFYLLPDFGAISEETLPVLPGNVIREGCKRGWLPRGKEREWDSQAVNTGKANGRENKGIPSVVGNRKQDFHPLKKR